MSITKAEIAEQARAYFDVDSSEVTDAIVSRWVTQGWTKIANKVVNWPSFEGFSTVNVTSGITTYPSPLSKVVGVSETLTDGPLTFVGQNEAEAYFLPVSGTARPTHWSSVGGNLVIWPTPNGNYAMSVRGYRNPVSPKGIGVTDPIDLPNEDCESVLEMWVLYCLALHQDDDLKAQAFRQEYAELMSTVSFDAVGGHVGPIYMNQGGTTTADLPPRLRFSFEA